MSAPGLAVALQQYLAGISAGLPLDHHAVIGMGGSDADAERLVGAGLERLARPGHDLVGVVVALGLVQ